MDDRRLARLGPVAGCTRRSEGNEAQIDGVGVPAILVAVLDLPLGWR
jgi:hypothetical protein